MRWLASIRQWPSSANATVEKSLPGNASAVRVHIVPKAVTHIIHFMDRQDVNTGTMPAGQQVAVCSIQRWSPALECCTLVSCFLCLVYFCWVLVYCQMISLESTWVICFFTFCLHAKWTHCDCSFANRNAFKIGRMLKHHNYLRNVQ